MVGPHTYTICRSRFGVLLMFAVMTLVWVGIPLGLFVLAYRLVRAQERRAMASERVVELTMRVAKLEDRLDAMATELSEVAEAQRFNTALLTGEEGDAESRRMSGARRLPPG